jgi:hypothetical protein
VPSRRECDADAIAHDLHSTGLAILDGYHSDEALRSLLEMCDRRQWRDPASTPGGFKRWVNLSREEVSEAESLAVMALERRGEPFVFQRIRYTAEGHKLRRSMA